jgi:hypothetical protein
MASCTYSLLPAAQHWPAAAAAALAQQRGIQHLSAAKPAGSHIPVHPAYTALVNPHCCVAACRNTRHGEKNSAKRVSSTALSMSTCRHQAASPVLAAAHVDSCSQENQPHAPENLYVSAAKPASSTNSLTNPAKSYKLQQRQHALLLRLLPWLKNSAK